MDKPLIRTESVGKFSHGGVSELQSQVIANSPAICAILDASGDILLASKGFGTLLSTIENHASDGQLCLSRLCKNIDWSLELERAQHSGTHAFDCWIERPAGRMHLHFTISHTPIDKTAQVGCFLLFAQDLEALQVTRDYNSLIAFQDRLTGLYNRRFLEVMMPDLIAAQTASAQPLGFAIIDIDHCEDLSACHGRAFVDALMATIAQQINALLPSDATLVYYAQGEFVLILDGVSAETRIQQLVETIKASFENDVMVGGTRVAVDLTIGVSFFPDHGRSLAQLLHHADEAMFQSAPNTSGRARLCEYAVATTPATAIHDLSLGLAGHQFRPFYQEIVDLKSGDCIGAEALCRWMRPEQTVVQPSEFITRAENFGLIAEIDRAMFHHICKDIFDGSSPRLSQGVTSFNVSATTLGQSSFLSFLQETLARFDLKPEQFCIELVESTFLVKNDPGRACLFALKDMGFSIALDDFGTGFSSLALLKDLPISRLKIDRSFVMDLPGSRRDQSIVDSILKLCQAIETEVVAEGIESAEQRDILTNMQAKFGQGFLFGRPRPVDQY